MCGCNTKEDGNFLVGFGKRVRFVGPWEDDEGSIESSP